MIVWLASYPRSGNTFTRVLLKSYFGIDTYSIYDDPHFERYGVADLVGHRRMRLTLDEMRASGETFIVKTHERNPDDSARIYVVRDGRDAAVSYAHYLCSIERPEGKKEALRRMLGGGCFRTLLNRVAVGDAEYGGWGEHVRSWLFGTQIPRTLVIRFEDLVLEPLGQVERLRNFLQLPMPLTTDEAPKFEELQRAFPEFFRKGVVGSWQKEMPEKIHRRFQKMNGKVLVALGYETDSAAMRN